MVREAGEPCGGAKEAVGTVGIARVFTALRNTSHGYVDGIGPGQTIFALLTGGVPLLC